MNGILGNGTFEAVNQEDVPERVRVFKSRFIDEIEIAGKGLRLKSHLVAQKLFR